MRVRAEDLPRHLERGLKAVYLISGPEVQIIEEAADAIRAGARECGHTERERFVVEPGFDWRAVVQAACSVSLFAARRILEVRLDDNKPGTAGAKALVQCCTHCVEGTLLLVICGRLDAAAERSAWLRTLDEKGIWVQVRAVEAQALPAWVARRLRDRGLSASPQAIALIAERVEGNLLAAAQEVEKLVALFGASSIDVDQVREAVTDNARFRVYDLADAVSGGDSARALRVVRGLREEGAEPVLVLWAITREIRELARMAWDLERGLALNAVMGKHRVWARRKGLVAAALRRHDLMTLQGFMMDCARMDRLIKGIEQGPIWDELIQLCLRIAGSDPFPAIGRRVK